ncbi:MAG: hypothetical protein ACPLXN_05730 [Sulfurihydrogenibium sp.]|uniref:hypothetical protein n=1 Tax=Sulfurihydrogenibium sp. TaxID=2053621 RepID=UPI003C7D996B
MTGVKLIWDFLKNNNTAGLDVIHNIFLKIISKQMFSALKDQEEELFNEFISTKILTSKEMIIKKFSENQSGLYNYLYVAIENFLKTELEKYIYMSESLGNPVYINQEEEEESYLEKYYNKEYDFLSEIESERIFEVMNEQLKEEEKKLLCSILSDNNLKDKYFPDLKEDAYYKRVERLKKKLKEIVEEYEFSKEGTNLFFDIFYNEVCKKLN